MMSQTFLTGSRVYGIPKLDSDYDIVILTDKETFELFKHLQFKLTDQDQTYNFICVQSKQEYNTWYNAKLQCLSIKPCSRDKAIIIHKKELAKQNMLYKSQSGIT